MTEGTPSGEIWVLGATGRIGRSVVTRLAGEGIDPVLVGRRRESLVDLQAGYGGKTGVVVADGGESIADAIRSRKPSVVINLIGNYIETAPAIADAVMPGGHYTDLASDATAVPQLLDKHPEAAAAGSTLVTGAGFGVLATESVVAKLCADRPAPRQVRVDALASVAMEAGVIGAPFASAMVGTLLNGGLRYENGQLVKTRLGADPQRLTLPDGETAKSGGIPMGELVAAQRASGAPSVSGTSGLAPTGTLVRAVLPLAATLLSVPPLRRLAVRQMAKATTKAAPRPRQHSWGHAVLTWPDGTVREGWLRADDGMDYTAAVITEVALRLARGEGKPGAYTPAAAFGPDLAVSAGGTFVLN
ncbi:saccharopine dehydrogenase NADP-binding domain-containing protein [Amycolatopsis ultiminotia]|uniref:Saccharopine dehydrogenase NADP-binding domain-containing protein n=2 Tax=Amycolatopsis ultiminotia TaxID=543629 RepID=A0ABP6YCJ2_9PSEU